MGELSKRKTLFSPSQSLNILTNLEKLFIFYDVKLKEVKPWS